MLKLLGSFLIFKRLKNFILSMKMKRRILTLSYRLYVEIAIGNRH